MTFHRLKAVPTGAIVLVNLHYMIADGLLDARLRKSALRSMKRALGRTSATPDAGSLKRALQSALFVERPVYQVGSIQRPALDKAVAMVVDFGRVRGLLRSFGRRIDDDGLLGRIDALCRSDVDRSDIPNAADLINLLAPNIREITLKDPNMVLWGASVPALDAAIATFMADPAIGAAGLAGRVRDLLGLVHIKPARRSRSRHLFLFRGNQTLETIRQRPTLFRCARPSTLDGFDNPRFCQPHLATPWEHGWGTTIDIAARRLAIGLPEVVVNPLSVCEFTCSYLGEVPDSAFGTDRAYLAVLARHAPALDDIADELDRLAA